MKTIALRFSDNFAPECGTIKAHEDVIEKYGSVWYGKLGSTISNKVIRDILVAEKPRILLIHSGKTDRYWAYVSDIKKDIKKSEQIPAYYRDRMGDFRTWFRVSKFELAPKDILGKCTVVSSETILGEVSKHSMSPYFIIEAPDD